MPFCIRFLYVIDLKKVWGMMNMSWLDDMIQKWQQIKKPPRTLSLSDTFAVSQFLLAQTFSVDELLGTRLALHRWEESHT